MKRNAKPLASKRPLTLTSKPLADVRGGLIVYKDITGDAEDSGHAKRID